MFNRHQILMAGFIVLLLGAQLRQFHRRHVPGVGHGQMQFGDDEGVRPDHL